MTSATPPYPYYNGITFNPAFFVQPTSTGGLTEAQANNLYLRKTVPDSATSLETFTGGIITNSIDTTTTSSVLNIGTTSLGDLNIGTTPNRTGSINIATGSASWLVKINAQGNVAIN